MAATERSMNFIAQCLEIKQAELKSQGDKTKVTVKLHGPRFEVKYDDFAQTNRDEYALFGRVIDTCKRLSHRLSDIEKRRTELNKEIEALKFYKNLDIRFSEVKDTTNTIMVLGYIPEVQEDTTEKLINACPSVAFEFSKGSTLMVFAVALKEDKNELMSQLNSYGFVPCPYNDNLDYKEKIDKINIELNELDTEVSEIRSRAIEFREYVPQLKVLYDFYSLNYQRVNTNEEIFYTDETYVLKAWYPEEKEEKLLKLIDKLTTAVAVETKSPI
jgi:Archaeal/vacuolar-type H+-ATPase subunit I